MKRAAIYARYSSNLQLESSIDDQIRLCRKRAADIGATVVEIYKDPALSGTLFESRPGIQRMLADAKKRRIDIVIAEGLDRLSRDQEDIAKIYKRLRHVDVKILTLADGAVGEMEVGLKGTMNALFITEMGNKVRRGQSGRVLAGRAAGGLAYGYRVVKKYDEKGEPIRGFREVRPDQAAVVCRIYQMFAKGVSTRAIAKVLNAEGVPTARGGEWNSSTIAGQKKRLNGILQNPIYIGRIVYNRVSQRQDPETAKYVSIVNLESDRVSQDVPALRIVSDALWKVTQQS
ncbi:MAG: recombinase family protein [Rhodospirillaceae bacterium]|nr:recombinase family protein [Rhodospirillaceae bacterium]